MIFKIYKNFIFSFGMVFILTIEASIASPNNPFMYDKVINGREYPFLNHKKIVNYHKAPELKVTGKGTTILVIDVSSPHTSQVISLINDAECGIAPNATVISKQAIFRKEGNIEESLPLMIREGYDEGANFISISFCDQFGNFYESWKDAFLEAKMKGVGILMSAGNKGKQLDKIYPGIENFLEKMDGSFLFVLASEYKNNSEMRAESSNYPTKDGNSVPYCITAPGDSILSKRYSEFEYFSGTSASTPIVVAAAAVLREANPHLTSQEVLKILSQSARKKRLSEDIHKEDHEEIRVLDLEAALYFKKAE